MVSAPTIVSVQRMPDYDRDGMVTALRSCLAPLGGMRAFVQPGQRVLLKPNLLGAFPVERAVTTHPSVVRAAILLVKEAGGLPLVGDSPGLGSLESVLGPCGLAPVIAETGARVLDFSEPHQFEVSPHQVTPRLTLAKALLEADVLISLPKLKTHGQMTMTAALKNQFGLIPGALKSQWHFRLQDPLWLARLILDVNRVARPSLSILDAVIGMEGQGPTSGRPRHLGALLASRDALAADTVACQLIGQDPGSVPLLAAAKEQGYGQSDMAGIVVVGEDWRALQIPNFEKIEQLTDVLQLLPLPRPALNWLRRQWTLRPRIVDGHCTQCGICEAACPVAPSAIHPENVPGERVEDDRCIRCYCCHEFCPSQGIELRAPWLARHLPLNALANGAGRVIGVISSIRKRP
jgi:uncharacterized protein (DUF362 family)